MTGCLLCTWPIEGNDANDKGKPSSHTVSSGPVNMTFVSGPFCTLSWVLKNVSQGPSWSAVHILTFQRLRDRLTPAALQRSGSGPSACCPAAPPYSVGSDDGSGWPLRMVLPRQRSTEHHAHLTASAVHLASILPFSGC